MAKDKMQAPQGMAGLVRYYEEDKSIIKMKPEHVLVLCTFLVAAELMVFYLL